MNKRELLSVAVLMGLNEAIIRESFDPAEYRVYLRQCRQAGKCPKTEFVRMLIEGEMVG
jgi:hypothetical protein